jgi:hypothetical protein
MAFENPGMNELWQMETCTARYLPACGKEWKPGVCHKPKVKCGECNWCRSQPE